MPKYGEKAKETVKEAMHKLKLGTLKSGGSKKTVKNSRQAVAIGLSEARKKGAKVPPSKKSTAKKAPAKSSAATRKQTSPGKKAATRKPAAKAASRSAGSTLRRPATKKRPASSRARKR